MVYPAANVLENKIKSPSMDFFFLLCNEGTKELLKMKAKGLFVWFIYCLVLFCLFAFNHKAKHLGAKSFKRYQILRNLQKVSVNV